MENKPYKITKDDAIILQNYCEKIKIILEKYSWTDPNKPNFVTSISRIRSNFNEFQRWIDIAYNVDSDD